VQAVSAYASHAAGTLEDLQQFLRGGEKCVFDNLIVTNTVPTTTKHIPEGDSIIVLDMLPQFLEDLF
jgi:phosphoribosylpyrophosphate synthetase